MADTASPKMQSSQPKPKTGAGMYVVQMKNREGVPGKVGGATTHQKERCDGELNEDIVPRNEAGNSIGPITAGQPDRTALRFNEGRPQLHHQVLA